MANKQQQQQQKQQASPWQKQSLTSLVFVVSLASLLPGCSFGTRNHADGLSAEGQRIKDLGSRVDQAVSIDTTGSVTIDQFTPLDVDSLLTNPPSAGVALESQIGSLQRGDPNQLDRSLALFDYAGVAETEVSFGPLFYGVQAEQLDCTTAETFSAQVPTLERYFGDIVATGSCGAVRARLCLHYEVAIGDERVSLRRYPSPVLEATIPCPTVTFAGMGVTIANGNAATLDRNVAVTFPDNPVVEAVYLSNTADCSAPGSWFSAAGGQVSPWNLLAQGNQSVDVPVSARFRDIVGFTSDCFVSSIRYQPGLGQQLQIQSTVGDTLEVGQEVTFTAVLVGPDGATASPPPIDWQVVQTPGGIATLTVTEDGGAIASVNPLAAGSLVLRIKIRGDLPSGIKSPDAATSVLTITTGSGGQTSEASRRIVPLITEGLTPLPTGVAGQQLATALQARVLGDADTPLENVQVEWLRKEELSGDFVPDSSNNAVATGPTGMASLRPVLPEQAGTYVYRARLATDNSKYYDFLVRAVHGPLAAITLIQQPTKSYVNQLLTTRPTVQAEDAFGNVVRDVEGSVVLSLDQGEGTVTGVTSVALLQGIADFDAAMVDTANAAAVLRASLTIGGDSWSVVSNPFEVVVVGQESCDNLGGRWVLNPRSPAEGVCLGLDERPRLTNKKPTFDGIHSVVSAGDRAVRVDWTPGFDDNTAPAALVYDIYAHSAVTSLFDQSPVLSVTGVDHAIVTVQETALLQFGSEVFFGVRARDDKGVADNNTNGLAATVFSPGQVAYVEAGTGTTGTLGSRTDTFPTISAAITALYGANGGIVLVQGAEGTPAVFTEQLAFTSPAPAIAVYGGFADFSSVTASNPHLQLLQAADPDRYQVLVQSDATSVVSADNTNTPIYLDGLTLLPGQQLSGILEVTAGSATVSGTGSAFTTELTVSDEIVIPGHTTVYTVSVINSDLSMDLNTAFTGETQTTAVYQVVATDPTAIRNQQAQLQVSRSTVPHGRIFTGATAVPGSVLRLSKVAMPVTPDQDLHLERFHRELNMMSMTFNPGGGNISFITYNGTTGMDLSPPEVLIRVANSQVDGELDLNFVRTVQTYPADVKIQLLQNHFFLEDRSAVDIYGYNHLNPNSSLLVEARENTSSLIDRHFMYVRADSSQLMNNVTYDFLIADNNINNVGYEVLNIETFAARDSSMALRVLDNQFTNAGRDCMEFRAARNTSLDAANNASTTVLLRGNTCSNIQNPVFMNNFDVTPYSLVRLDVLDNIFSASQNEPFRIEDFSLAGASSTAVQESSSLWVMNIHNNLMIGSEDNVRIDFSNSPQVKALAAITNNTMGFSGDANGSAVAVDFDDMDHNHQALIQRNFFGYGGRGSDEAVYLNSREAPGRLIISNNIMGEVTDLGIYVRGEQPFLLTNNTFTRVTVGGSAGGIRSGDDYQFTMQNNIVAAEPAPSYYLGDERLSVGYSLMDAEPLSSMTFGNLVGVDPIFETTFANSVDRTVANINGLYKLAPNSPAIDAGNPLPRFNDADGSRNDLGAYGGPQAGSIGFSSAQKLRVSLLPMQYLGTHDHFELDAGGKQLLRSGDPILFMFNKKVDASTLDAGFRLTNNGLPIPGTWSLPSEKFGYGALFTPTTTLTAPSVAASPPGSLRLEIEVNPQLQSSEDDGGLHSTFRDVLFVRPDVPEGKAGSNDLDTISDAQTLNRQGGFVLSWTGSLNGANPDADFYAFTASAGERLEVTLLSSRIGTSDQPGFTLHDNAGTLLQDGEGVLDYDDLGSEAYIEAMIPADGTYYLQISGNGTDAYEGFGVLE